MLSSSYYHVFIIALSWSHHRTILLSWLHHRTMVFLSSFYQCGSIIVILCFHNRTFGFHHRTTVSGFHHRTTVSGFHHRTTVSGFHYRTTVSGFHHRTTVSGFHHRTTVSGFHYRTIVGSSSHYLFSTSYYRFPMQVSIYIQMHEQFLLFPQCFLPSWRTFCHFNNI